MSKLHIKKDDTVIVLTGSDKGKTGKVLKVLVEEQRAIVEGINIVSKNAKPITEHMREELNEYGKLYMGKEQGRDRVIY